MGLPLWLLVSMDVRHSHRLGPSPILGSLGPSHQRCHKSWVSLWGPFCVHGVLGILQRQVRVTHTYQTESMPSSIILIVDTLILELLAFMVGHCVYLRMRPLQCICKFDIAAKVYVPRWFVSNFVFVFQWLNLHWTHLLWDLFRLPLLQGLPR